jgi:hypothetical protein
MTWLARSAPLVLTGLLALAPADATAQTSLQIPLQFGTSTLERRASPSARLRRPSNDATAVRNPAGLVQLGASGVSFELAPRG